MISIAELLSEKKKLRDLEKQIKKQKEVRKEYLSEADRQEFILLAAIGGKMEEILKSYIEYRRPPTRRRYLKTAITYVFKVLDDYFVGMSEKEKEKEVYKMIRDLRAGRYEVCLIKKY